MPTIEVELEVWCSCGNGLCNQSSVKTGRYLGITVEPCEKCLAAAREDGYEKARVEDSK